MHQIWLDFDMILTAPKSHYRRSIVVVISSLVVEVTFFAEYSSFVPAPPQTFPHFIRIPFMPFGSIQKYYP
jgi:hypothetical protein